MPRYRKFTQQEANMIRACLCIAFENGSVYGGRGSEEIKAVNQCRDSIEAKLPAFTIFTHANLDGDVL